MLRTKGAVKTFSGDVHFSVGAGLSAAAGIIGRAAEADVHAGVGGCAACYTYSCSKGIVFHSLFLIRWDVNCLNLAAEQILFAATHCYH